MKRPPPRVRRTGYLVLPPQIVLADLEAIPPAIANELLYKVWPLVEQERARAREHQEEQFGRMVDLDDEPPPPDTRAHRIAACILEYAGRELYERLEREQEEREEDVENDSATEDDGAIDSAWLEHDGPLWKYGQLGFSDEAISLVARFHDQQADGARRLADAAVGGGCEYVYDDHPEVDSWLRKPIAPDFLVHVHARTLALVLELTSGGPELCKATEPGPGPYPSADEALKKLAERLRTRLHHLPAALLEDDLAVIAVLITSLAGLLRHASLQRDIDKGRKNGVRADLYLAALDYLDLGESRETVRRIVEAHHPDPISLDLPLPSGGQGETPRTCRLLERWRDYLVPTKNLAWFFDPGGEPVLSVDGRIVSENSPKQEEQDPLFIYTIDSTYKEISGQNHCTSRSQAILPVSPIVPQPPGGQAPLDRGIVDARESEIRGTKARDGLSPRTTLGSSTSYLALREEWFRPVEPLSVLRERLSASHLDRALHDEHRPGVQLGIIYRELKRTSGQSVRKLRERSHELNGNPIQRCSTCASPNGRKKTTLFAMRTAEQIVHAAGILEEELPGLYSYGLLTIISGEPSLWLGEYNRLVDFRGLAGDLQGEDRKRVLDLVMSELPMPAVEQCVKNEYPASKRVALARLRDFALAGKQIVDAADAVADGLLQRDEAIALLDEHLKLVQCVREKLETLPET